nr:MAG TPA: hypothetical protein [Caudoviricetes sp.]
MTKEQAIERLKKMIQINNGVIKEARKNGDIFAMQLTADLDTDSIAIEKVLTMLEEKDKTIDLMSEQLAGLAIFNIDKDETLILSDKEEVK